MSRTRRYKVTYFGEPLGTYLMPFGEHMDDPKSPTRPVVSKPFLIEDGEDYAICWAEVEPEVDDYINVVWRPDTAEEREEAQRFYQTAHGLLPDGRVDHAAQPPMPTRTMEEVQLIRAVLANPDEQAPYLTYADWLTANGDPYGKYLRIALRKEPLSGGDKLREELEEKLDVLECKYGAKWIRALTELGLFPGDDQEDEESFDPGWWYDDKGVISDLEIPSGTFVFRKNPARLFAGAPFLRSLNILANDISPEDLAPIPQMAQLDSLYFESGSTDNFGAFTDSPHFSGLRSLTISGYGLDAENVWLLANARWMPSLTSLSLSSNSIGEEGAQAIADSPHCGSLESLQLFNEDIGDRGLIALCRSRGFPRLQSLDVQLDRFTVESVRALSNATFVPNLKYLELTGCQLDADALAVLAASHFPVLEVIDISEKLAGDAAIRPFLAAPYFRTLEVFWANHCNLTNSFIRALASSGFLALEDLSLSHNKIDDAGIELLVNSPAVRKVKYLHLGGNDFGIDGIQALADAELPVLEGLSLNQMRLGREIVETLVGARWRKQIKWLLITEARIGERSLEILIDKFGEDAIDFEETYFE